jgi:predicted HAD superfamily phosphohydrolase
MYVGDSITDAPPLAAVRDWAGLAVSFNGNGYALEAAEIAVAGLDTGPTLKLARAFAAGGAHAARELARAWPAPAPAADGAPGLPVVGVIADDPEALAAASRAARASVRGEHIARLG